MAPCLERRRCRVRRTALTTKGTQHVATRTGPTNTISHEVMVSEDCEPLTQLFQVLLPTVNVINAVITTRRVAAPKHGRHQKGQRGTLPPLCRPYTDTPWTTSRRTVI